MKTLLLFTVFVSQAFAAPQYKVTAPQFHTKGFTRKPLDFAVRGRGFPKVQLPGAYKLGKLSQIENQGNCGSCWAFSLTASLRDLYLNKVGRDPGRLSQEWLVDNAKQAFGCNGGYFDAAENLIVPGGSPLWSKCPYAEGSGNCPASLPPVAHIAAYHMLGGTDGNPYPSTYDIEYVLAVLNRPVSISVAAASGDWESYRSGVYDGCTMGEPDHMINVVGYDNEGASFDEKGMLPAGKGVYVLRNSWGIAWGEQGFMRTKITDGRGQRCNNVAVDAAYFTLPSTGN